MLDSGTPRRTMVLRPPGSAHISMTRVAHSNRTATHPADHINPNPARTREINTPGLTNLTPYQLSGGLTSS